MIAVRKRGQKQAHGQIDTSGVVHPEHQRTIASASLGFGGVLQRFGRALATKTGQRAPRRETVGAKAENINGKLERPAGT